MSYSKKSSSSSRSKQDRKLSPNPSKGGESDASSSRGKRQLENRQGRQGNKTTNNSSYLPTNLEHDNNYTKRRSKEESSRHKRKESSGTDDHNMDSSSRSRNRSATRRERSTTRRDRSTTTRDKSKTRKDDMDSSQKRERRRSRSHRRSRDEESKNHSSEDKMKDHRMDDSKNRRRRSRSKTSKSDQNSQRSKSRTPTRDKHDRSKSSTRDKKSRSKSRTRDRTKEEKQQVRSSSHGKSTRRSRSKTGSRDDRRRKDDSHKGNSNGFQRSRTTDLDKDNNSEKPSPYRRSKTLTGCPERKDRDPEYANSRDETQNRDKIKDAHKHKTGNDLSPRSRTSRDYRRKREDESKDSNKSSDSASLRRSKIVDNPNGGRDSNNTNQTESDLNYLSLRGSRTSDHPSRRQERKRDDKSGSSMDSSLRRHYAKEDAKSSNKSRSHRTRSRSRNRNNEPKDRSTRTRSKARRRRSCSQPPPVLARLAENETMLKDDSKNTRRGGRRPEKTRRSPSPMVETRRKSPDTNKNARDRSLANFLEHKDARPNRSRRRSSSLGALVRPRHLLDRPQIAPLDADLNSVSGHFSIDMNQLLHMAEQETKMGQNEKAEEDDELNNPFFLSDQECSRVVNGEDEDYVDEIMGLLPEEGKEEGGRIMKKLRNFMSTGTGENGEDDGEAVPFSTMPKYTADWFHVVTTC